MSSSSASRKRPAPGSVPAAPTGVGTQPQSHTYATPNPAIWNGAAAVANNYTDSAVSGAYALQQQHLVQQAQVQTQGHPQQPHQAHQQQPTVNGYQIQGQTQGYNIPLHTEQQQQHIHQQQQPQVQTQVHPHNSPPMPSSNMVAHRTDSASRALVPSRPTFDVRADMQWPSDDNALVPVQNSTDPEEQWIREAMIKAIKVRDAQATEGASKRSIPPFVMKLATFLNQATDTNLIRWSDKGDSFLVLDEDEFARTLIPQLFKHANYASFVRQLNMYGFHKRVGLSDNSMRSSEKKNKAPSEYAHQYFRKGYDVLQWLIQKPSKKKMDAEKRKTAAGGDRDEAYDIDSDDDYEKPQAAPTSGPLAKTEMSSIREQLKDIHTQQQKCLAMIQNLRNNQTDIMSTAQRVEQQYQGHDRSIHQILNFLASVFRKSLEGQNSERLAEMVASFVPHPQGQPSGSVRDWNDNDVSGQGNFNQQQHVAERILSPIPRQRQHLLPGIPAHTSSVNTPAASSGYQAPSVAHSSPQEASRVTELYDNSPDDTTSPNEHYRNEVEANPQGSAMNLMGASNGSINSPSPMTPDPLREQQRRRLYTQKDQEMSQSKQSIPMNVHQSYQNTQQSPLQHTSQNSPLSNMPPAGNIQPNAPQSISSNATNMNQMHDEHSQPIGMGFNPLAALTSLATTPAAASGLMEDANNAQASLDQLESMHQDVEQGLNSFAKLAAQLNPEIPSYDGAMDDNLFSVNGLADGDNFDPNAWLQGDDHSLFENDMANNDLPNFDFGLASAPEEPSYGNEFQGLTDEQLEQFNGIESLSMAVDAEGILGLGPSNNAHDTPSPAVTEEIERADLADFEMPAAKRHRAL